MHYDITHKRVDLDSFYSIKISCNLQAKPCYDLRWIIIAFKSVETREFVTAYDVIVVSRLHTSITILNLFSAYISL